MSLKPNLTLIKRQRYNLIKFISNLFDLGYFTKCQAALLQVKIDKENARDALEDAQRAQAALENTSQLELNKQQLKLAEDAKLDAAKNSVSLNTIVTAMASITRNNNSVVNSNNDTSARLDKMEALINRLDSFLTRQETMNN